MGKSLCNYFMSTHTTTSTFGFNNRSVSTVYFYLRGHALLNLPDFTKRNVQSCLRWFLHSSDFRQKWWTSRITCPKGLTILYEGLIIFCLPTVVVSTCIVITYHLAISHLLHRTVRLVHSRQLSVLACLESRYQFPWFVIVIEWSCGFDLSLIKKVELFHKIKWFLMFWQSALIKGYLLLVVLLAVRIYQLPDWKVQYYTCLFFRWLLYFCTWSPNLWLVVRWK